MEGMLQTIGEAMKDEGSSFAFKVLHPDYPNGAPAKR